ncbi:MAG TPA: DUF4252 domain-containing protein [Bacteroidales bacterium]|nr:DUF4252 domain-containing protein [Bacteroidales bacterium]
MKNLAFVFVAIAFSMHVSAQDPIHDVFNQYAGKEGFTTVNITGELLNMMIAMDESCKHQKDLSTRIHEIKILAQEEGFNSGVNFHELIYNKINRNDYKDLLTVRESDENVNILAKESEGIITEFLLIVSGDENVLISIKGDIVLNELGDLAESIDMEGFEMLKMLESH